MANPENNLGPWAMKILSWIGSGLAGAFLVLLLNSSGDRRDLKNTIERVDKLEQVQSTYATNKRVDDLTTEIRGGLQSLNTKVDDVLKYLISTRK